MKNGLFEKFTKICVDNNQSIPAAIKSVPTILVPSHQKVLKNSETLKAFILVNITVKKLF